jgi:cupin fold WbuC family metalloprotein
MRTTPFNREVLYPDEAVVKVTHADVAGLKSQAAANERGRFRLCTHRDVKDTLHEMIIVLRAGTYIRPHKHLNRCESFHVLEGRADVALFDDDGNLLDVIRMGDYASRDCFYYRLSDSVYHSVVTHTPEFIFHETTNGPFDPNQTIFAPWAPADDGQPAVEAFLDKLTQALLAFRIERS